MELLTVIILRSAERILAIVIGSLLAYLGFRLFLEVPTTADSEGKFSLPSGAAIHLTRVGPGVFFALFGTGIVVLSFLNPITYAQDLGPRPSGAAAAESAKASYLGAGPATAGAASRTQRLEARASHQRDVAVLNRLPDLLRPDLDPQRRNDVKSVIHRVKLALMESIWVSDDWGDVARFRDWTRTEDPPSDDIKKAAAYFNAK